ncbi:MAG: TonB-dependent receptor, partial [Deltaproteobacteria bacterium]|nr:TonB-dependent receptor [Deltaproteobacteria bacterium]
MHSRFFMRYKKTAHAGLLFFVCCLFLQPAASAWAQAETTGKADFTTYSLEELMNIELVSAAKKPQTAYESAAAVYVITQEDIRRSGAVNLPEALRMAPGIQVSRSDPGQFAVTSRGFLGEFANKLLVLIDGRSVYSPLFSGTMWDYRDVLLENIERIEVIRGPGATLWGANAVNGVINIITKHAKDVQGGMAVATVSNEEGYDGLRYGVKLKDNMYLSSYVKYMNYANVINDKWIHEPRQVNGGARLDWDMTDTDKLFVSAGYYDAKTASSASRPVVIPPLEKIDVKGDADLSGGHALARWDHTFSATSNMQLQLFYDGGLQSARRSTPYKPAQDSPVLGKDLTRIDTYDFDFQHSFAADSRNSIIWGVNARYNRVKKRDFNIYFTLASEKETQRLYSAFVQDEIQLVPERLSLTVGSKFEYNSSTQLELQPSIRMLYTPSDTQSFWAAVSRAVRTPSVLETDGFVPSAYLARGSLFPLSPPGVVEMQGSEDYNSEQLLAYEAGHRAQLAQNFSLDTALYYNVYSDLRSLEPASPQVKQGYFIIPV